MDEHDIPRQIGNQEDLARAGNWNRDDSSVGIGRLLRLGCAPLIAMMKTASLRHRNDGSAVRRVLGPREVHPGFVIVRHEQLHLPVRNGGIVI